MEKPNVVVIGYGFAGRCFHAYLVGLADGLNLYGIATKPVGSPRPDSARLGGKNLPLLR